MKTKEEVMGVFFRPVKKVWLEFLDICEDQCFDKGRVLDKLILKFVKQYRKEKEDGK